MTVGRTPTGRSAWAPARQLASAVFVLVGFVLALTALAAHFVHNDLLDTERYVETVGPLADDPSVQAEVTAEVTNRISDAANLEDLGPVGAGAENVLRDAVRSAVGSAEFAQVWVEANRIAHREFVAVVTGREGDVAIEGGGTVTLQLGDLIAEAAGDPLADLGVDLTEILPDAEIEVVVIDPDVVAAAQEVVPWLDPVAGIAPWLTLAAWIIAVLLAPRGSRAGTLAGIGLAATIAGAVILVAADAGRSWYLDSLPPDGLPLNAAASLYDALVDPLQSRAWVVLIAGAVVAVGAFIASLVRRHEPRDG